MSSVLLCVCLVFCFVVCLFQSLPVLASSPLYEKKGTKMGKRNVEFKSGLILNHIEWICWIRILFQIFVNGTLKPELDYMNPNPDSLKRTHPKSQAFDSVAESLSSDGVGCFIMTG